MNKWEYLQQIDDEVAEITKGVDTEKMWEEIRVKHNIPKDKVAIEITESADAECTDRIIHTILQLKSSVILYIRWFNLLLGLVLERFCSLRLNHPTN